MRKGQAAMLWYALPNHDYTPPEQQMSHAIPSSDETVQHVRILNLNVFA